MIFHTLPISILAFILIFTRLSTSLANETELYANCRNPFQCANIQNIGYPFWGGDRLKSCGHPSFELNCETEGYPQITIQSSKYQVLSIDSTKSSITVVRSEFWDSFCPSTPSNATLDTPYLTCSSISENITLYYGCLFQNPLFPNHFYCHPGEGNTTSYYRTQYHGSNIFNLISEPCHTNVLVQVNHTSAKALSSNPPSIDISIALRSGFELVWDVNNDECSRCVQSDGVCGSNPNSESSSFSCFCSDRAYEVSCNNSGSGIGRKSHSKLIKIGLFVAGAVAGCLALGFAIFICRKRRKRNVVKSAEFRETKTKDIPFAHLSKSLTATSSSTSFSRSTHSFPSSKYDSGKPSSYYGVKVFHYTELEEATDNFNPSRELGDGGFGMVFYGKLDDGREVAVKRFYENNFKRVGQFMNEVDILKELSHTNLVKLYGYTSRRSRELLLVYEYIPNGTVADHLHGKRAKSGLLSWPIRLSIAIETAEALAYLHKSKIIHRDVKTTNILLENNFRVKVADFGLSRLFPNDVTHVSTIPQGTPGYVDPEYHRCYHLTEKSDVYSFGVVLVELISSKQAVDITRDRHDINLSNMAVNKIQNGKIHELVDPSLGFETNSSVERMITLVAEIAFRCLQDERDMRPSMEELLEALKRIKNNENVNATKVMDIVIGDEAALLKNSSLQISPNSVTVEKWISNATMPNNNILSTF